MKERLQANYELELGVPLEDRVLNEIDGEDVIISPQATKVLRQAAQSLFRTYPSVDVDRLTSMEAMALFSDRLEWDEASGELLMWSESGDSGFCVAIPADHWMVNCPGSVQ